MSDHTPTFKKPKPRDRKTKYKCDDCRKSKLFVSQPGMAYVRSPINRHVVFIHPHKRWVLASTMREMYRERTIVLEADVGVTEKKRQEATGNMP